MRLEHHRQPLASSRTFWLRQLRYLGAAMAFVLLSLSVGTWGYMRLARLTFVDAFMNASMILGGMGPVNELPDDRSKIFAALFALYSGIALLTTVAVILTPLVHRLLHRLHMDDDQRIR